MSVAERRNSGLDGIYELYRNSNPPPHFSVEEFRVFWENLNAEEQAWWEDGFRNKRVTLDLHMLEELEKEGLPKIIECDG